MQDVIEIRALSKRNGFTSALIGLSALFVGAMMLAWLPEQLRLVSMFVLSAGIVALLIGWFKIREPAHSLLISKQTISYKHRNGEWLLEWNNVQRVDIPTSYQDMQHRPLSVIGIRVNNYEPILENISPRLATNILMEQRPLLLQTLKENCTTGNCYSEGLIEDDSYVSKDGTRYKGIKAMFANRMTRLRDSLGYDLYINVAELDRPAQEFVKLMRDCQSEVTLNNS